MIENCRFKVFFMLMYEIESFNKRKNKKFIILIIIIAVVAIASAVFGAIKLAEHVAYKKQLAEENNIIEESEKETGKLENEEDSIQKLTEEQIKAIKNIYKSEEKRAFLTFDDGPSDTVTPLILDILKKEDIKATFFVLGTMVKSNPEILKRERAEGHYIANHGYSHVYKKVYKDENAPLQEYQKANKLIQDALGESDYQANVFRFPGGSVGGPYDKVKTKAKKKFEENGIAYLDWNCLTKDSDGADTKNAIMKNLKETCNEKNSIVVLMHDAPNKSLTAETLPDVISYLRKQGYSFKNLYDII